MAVSSQQEVYILFSDANREDRQFNQHLSKEASILFTVIPTGNVLFLSTDLLLQRGNSWLMVPQIADHGQPGGSSYG